MSGARTIGGLAREAGVPVSTVRYYERRGLLTPSERTRSRYRLYHPDALERLRFIKAAQASGFSLDDIETLLDLRDDGRPPRSAVRTMIESRLADIRDRLESLAHVRGVLEDALAACRKGGPGEPCPVLRRLCACGANPLTLHPGSTPIMGTSKVGERPRRTPAPSARSVRQ